MAANNATETDPNTKEHLKTYSGFVTLTKWSIIALAILLVLLFAFVFS